MKHSIEFAFDGSFAVVRASGHPTVEGFGIYWADLVSRPEWQRGMPVLVDLRDLAIHTLSAEQVREIIEVHRPFATVMRECRVAPVFSQTSHFGLFRMFQTLSTDIFGALAGFYCIDKAKEWLVNDPSMDRGGI